MKSAMICSFLRLYWLSVSGSVSVLMSVAESSMSCLLTRLASCGSVRMLLILSLTGACMCAMRFVMSCLLFIPLEMR